MKKIILLLAIFSAVHTFAQNVGIGETAPANKLSVKGDLSVGAAYSTTAAPGNGAIIEGNTGIGTTTPLTQLDVAGNALVRGNNTNTTVQTPIAAVEFAIGRQQNGTMQGSQTSADIAFQYAGGGYRHFIMSRHFSGAGSNTNAIDFYLNNTNTSTGSSAPGTGNINMMSITAEGVGINTNAPTELLDIKGSDYSSGVPNGLVLDNPTANISPNILFNGPSHVFAINGSTGSGSSLGAGCYGLYDMTASNYRYVVTTNGHTGIGTTAPGSILEIGTYAGSGDTSELRISSINVGWGSTRLSYYSDRGSGNEWRPGFIVSGDNSPGNFLGRLDFGTNGSGYTNKTGEVVAMSICNGKVGIGVQNPTSTLSIGATNQFQVNSTGNIISLNNVATSFPATQGAANTIMKNDGSGNLSWVTPGSLLTAGTGITLTGNTINSTWTQSGTNIYNNNTGNVGINTATPGSITSWSTGPMVDVAGNIYGNNIWMKVGEQTVTAGSSTTSITFSGLNGSTDKMYKLTLEGEISCAENTSDIACLLRFNGDATTGDYRSFGNMFGDNTGSNTTTNGIFLFTSSWTSTSYWADFVSDISINSYNGPNYAAYAACTGSSSIRNYNSSGNADAMVGFNNAGAWISTAGITSMTIQLTARYFYGLKATLWALR